MNLLILNGPNLNRLGRREPGIYGHQTMDDYLDVLRARYAGHRIDYFQSNSEGSIIDSIHAARLEYDGIVLNAGAYTHYSYAIHDAIAAIKIPVIEVHLSNISSRDEFRKTSVIAPVCAGSIAGFGKYSYMLAIQALDYLFEEKK